MIYIYILYNIYVKCKASSYLPVTVPVSKHLTSSNFRDSPGFFRVPHCPFRKRHHAVTSKRAFSSCSSDPEVLKVHGGWRRNPHQWMASRSVDMSSEWLRKASILRIIVINPYGTSTVQEWQLDFNPKEDFCQLFSICPLPPFLQHPLCCGSHLKPAAGDLHHKPCHGRGAKRLFILSSIADELL